MPTSTPTLALLSGGGTLPAMVAGAAHAKGWPVHLLTFEGQPQPAIAAPLASAATFNIARIGAILAHLKAQRATHVVLAGNLSKPNILKLRPDFTGLKLLPRFGGDFHDDNLLRTIAAFLHEQGFTVLPVTDLLPALAAPAGPLGKHRPTKADLADIEMAFEKLKHLGNADIGQSVIVMDGVVLGVEAIEGTDALIERCAPLRKLKKGERGGWLVKAAKPAQTNLADLPAVGPATLELLAEHGYRGLAVQAGKTLLLDSPTLTMLADKSGLVLLGSK